MKNETKIWKLTLLSICSLLLSVSCGEAPADEEESQEVSSQLSGDWILSTITCNGVDQSLSIRYVESLNISSSPFSMTTGMIAADLNSACGKMSALENLTATDSTLSFTINGTPGACFDLDGTTVASCSVDSFTCDQSLTDPDTSMNTTYVITNSDTLVTTQMGGTCPEDEEEVRTYERSVE